MNPRVPGLALTFAQLSFFAVGGANSVLPEMQRTFVDARGWLDGPLFTSLVALAQAAPGPNAMVVGLVGWHAAGGLGALAATLGFCAPSSILTLLIGRAWGRLRATGLGPMVIEGLAPLTVGLVLASGWSLTRAQGLHLLPLAITALAALGALRQTQSGLWLLAGGAGLAVLLG
jgi:chromate transporter